jgi:hypothetical protein
VEIKETIKRLEQLSADIDRAAHDEFSPLWDTALDWYVKERGMNVQDAAEKVWQICEDVRLAGKRGGRA